MSVEEPEIITERAGETAVTPSPLTETPTPEPTSRKLSWESFAFVLVLIILLIGAYFRFTGLNWDATYHLHPDERFLTIVSTQIQPEYNPLQYFKTSESTLNPYNQGQGFFVYGNFPLTVSRYAAETVNLFCTAAVPQDPGQPPPCPYNFTNYDGVHLLGRFLSGLMDL
ncbi:MAG: hypothetical protein GY796_23430, partial [Chloroflexi bacterium]|nr:hypothetical protein [Chloroflexota bacterium]